MPAPLSYSLRRQIYEASCWDSPASVAERFGVSVPTVYRLRRLVRTSGFIEAKPRGGGRALQITDDDRSRFEAYLAENPAMSCREMAERFAEDTGRSVTRQTVQARLSGWGIKRSPKAAHPPLPAEGSRPQDGSQQSSLTREASATVAAPDRSNWHTLRLRLPDRPAGDETSLSPTVLVVEDQPELQHLIAALVDRACPLVMAACADEALRAASVLERIDLVLLDIHLGDGPTGLDVLPQLRACRACAQARFVAMTAYARPGDEGTMMAAGFNRFIPKPFGRGVLRELIEEMVPRHDTR